MTSDKRQRIAILCGQADEEFQKMFIEGFEKQAFEFGFDVCVFAMYMKFQENKRREQGESKIYDLINYELFDGFVVLGDTIQTPGVLDKLDETLHEKADAPVIFVDSESKYFKTINLKHYDAIVKLIEHLIIDHGYKDIAFISGKAWHPHSKERMDAFVATMAKHGLPIRENRMMYGDFWYTSGSKIAEEFIVEGYPLPEAFACANDYMAIGVAGALTRNGIRVPEDVAVIGYDSVEEARNCPSPITSIPLPVRQYGEYIADSLIRLISGQEAAEFKPDYDMFIGGSCGCHCESCVPRVLLRSSWKPDLLAKPYFSYDNRIAEDMSVEATLTGMLEVIKSYMYQIGDFASFRFCLNSEWVENQDLNNMTEYSDTIYEVMTSRNGGKDTDIDLNRKFPAAQMLPELLEYSDKPRSYLFTPLHFDSMCFGYAVLSYGHDIVGMDVTYLFWLRTVMMGFEALRRRLIFERTQSVVREVRFTDPLTGLYNYNGLVEHIFELKKDAPSVDVTVIAVDISGVGIINEKFGRREGDKIIIKFSKFIKSCTGSESVYGRLGNDEFIIAVPWHDRSEDSVDNTIKRLRDLLDESNKGHTTPITFAYGYSFDKVSSQDDIERLLNNAVSNKNGNKIRDRKLLMTGDFSKEEQEMAKRVEDLLDNNKFDYHFQPIADAKTGMIFAYEALMRPVSDPYIPPTVVIEYAERMGRLEEVEKYTFLNVLNVIENNLDAFRFKKVFINSLPGIKVRGDDRTVIMNKLRKISDMVVIELTEHSELDDETLTDMKDYYRRLGLQSAVDDYGTGYSNVVNLLRYMPDYVKIDRMLIAGIEDNPQKQHFVSEVIRFAHENRFKVLAEGVETSAELETSIKLGTDFIQGYYTGRPVKEIAKELAPSVREEIFRYYEKYFDKLMGTEI